MTTVTSHLRHTYVRQRYFCKRTQERVQLQPLTETAGKDGKPLPLT